MTLIGLRSNLLCPHEVDGTYTAVDVFKRRVASAVPIKCVEVSISGGGFRRNTGSGGG